VSEDKLKLLLIQPSTKDCVRTLFSIYNTEEGIGYKPPIGLLYIATTVNQKSSHSAKILDCQLDDVNHENVLDYIDEDYDVIGISAWTDFWFQAVNIAKKIKEKYPRVHLNMGGPHVNVFPEEVLRFDCVDSVILGDGEYPMVNLLEYLSKPKELSKRIDGVYFKEEQYTEFRPFICEDLDSVPIPDRTLLPVERYKSVLSSNAYITTMISSRGCPFKCVYCKLEFQRPKSRSAASVVEEFKQIDALGIKEVEIYDDTFNWDHKRTREICEGILENNLKTKWSVRDRVDRAEDGIYGLMKKAGCYRIHLGVETGVDRVLKAIKKKITTEQAKKAIELAKKYKFVILTYFMFGLPEETVEDAKKTIDFALELNTDYAEFSITIPYPGTESYEGSLRDGIIPRDYWREFTRDPSPNYVIPYVIENLISKDELIELRNESIQRFYFRPRYMIREFFRIRNFKELGRKIEMGLGLLDIVKKKA